LRVSWVEERVVMTRLLGVRVLVIENVADIRDVLVLLLRSEGADVVATPSGREGADLARNHHFDAVLSDLGLPDLAGDALIRELRAASGLSTRVVVITGYSEPYLTRAREAGADAVFTKPVDWTAVRDCVGRPVAAVA